MEARRIIPRDQVIGTLRVAQSIDPRHTCSRRITLDGIEYHCTRATRPHDRQHDGIHDAFVSHHDSGAVRW